jgi:hypothetical protein
MSRKIVYEESAFHPHSLPDISASLSYGRRPLPKEASDND